MASTFRPRRHPRFGRRAVRVEPLENRQLLAASLVSIDTTSFSSGNDVSQDPDISSNGRFVVFTSEATDLVTGDTNTFVDIYLRDLESGTTTLVSVGTGGASANGDSTDPSVSDNGRFVAFTSTASNLVAGDTNGVADVFVRDLFTNTTELVSVGLATPQNPAPPANGPSIQPSINDDGTLVAFASDATNLATNDLTATRDVYTRLLTNDVTTLMSVNAANTAGGNGPSQAPFLSSDGTLLTFISEATDLPGGAGGPGADVYLRTSTTTTLVSTTNGTTGGLVDPANGPATVSDSGRYVAFSSAAADLFAGDINGVADVFRRDLNPGGDVELVSQSSAGVFSNGASVRPVISTDGRFVAFSSVATNLALPDTAAGSDIFIRDMDNFTTQLVSTNLTASPGSATSNQPAMSDDATRVVFASNATNLVTEPVTSTNIFLASTTVFGNDIATPSFRIPAPQPAGPEVAAATLPFTVIYDDNVLIDTATLDDLDLTVDGPNGFSSPATFFALIGTTGTSTIVVYTVPAPDGTLSSADNGTYTVTLRGAQVADEAGNFIPGGGTGTFELNLPASETVLPRPTFFGGSPAVGAPTYEFTVVYEERGGLNFNTFGGDDVVVTGPNGFSQNATLVSSGEVSETTTSVTYQITAPGGTWDAPDNGVYTVSVISGGVTDVAGNSVTPGAFAQFVALGPDLIAIPLRNLRSGAISGVDTQRAKVRILNQGTSPSTVPIAVTLFTSLDETLDGTDATIATFVSERDIPPDDFVQISVRFTYPTVPTGDYFVLAQVDSSNAVIEQDEGNNIDASFKKVGLSAPFVDLVPTLIPFSGNRSRLGTNEVLVKIRNAGNVPAIGELVVGLTAVSDVTPQPSERPVANVPISVKLRPGQSRTFRLPFTFPIEFERGTYRMFATVDLTNVLGERDEANNRVQSLSAFDFA